MVVVVLCLSALVWACTSASQKTTDDPLPVAEPSEAAETHASKSEAREESILDAAPDATNLLFENDWVRVVRFTLDTGESLPVHEGHDRVIFSETAAHIQWTEGDASPREVHWQAGDVHTHGAEAHSVANVGEASISWVVFARKEMALLSPSDALEDAAETDEHLAKVVFDDDLARVLWVSLKPGEETHLHEGGDRIIYALSDYEIRFSTGTESPVERSWESGDVHWHRADQHQIKNIGTTQAEYLVVQFRR